MIFTVAIIVTEFVLHHHHHHHHIRFYIRFTCWHALDGVNNHFMNDFYGCDYCD